MCVLGLAATHDAVVQARTRGGIPCSMAYNKKWDAAKGVQVTGKKRKDACVTQADTEVCVLKCGDREFSVRCGVKGKLIELKKTTGYHLNVVTMRKLQFTPDPFEFSDKVLENWYPTLEQGNNNEAPLMAGK